MSKTQTYECGGKHFDRKGAYMERQSELKCIHSTVLSKNGKPFVSVMFERGNDRAEGTVPDCVITKSEGFTEEEIEELEDYMKAQRKEIIENAKRISDIRRLLS